MKELKLLLEKLKKRSLKLEDEMLELDGKGRHFESQRKESRLEELDLCMNELKKLL